MKNFLVLFTLFFGLAGTAMSQEDPSIIPRQAMEKMSVLVGDWQLQTEILDSETQTWAVQGIDNINMSYIEKNLGLREEKVSHVSGSALGASWTISFDQFRNHYRIAVLDDTWGVLDIYEGNIEGDSLIVTNLEKNTGFLLEDGQTMYFRLSIELKDDRRVMGIEMTLNNGEEWLPFYRLIYTRLAD